MKRLVLLSLLLPSLAFALAHPAHADFKLRLSYPAVVGTWTQGANLNGANSDFSEFVRFTSAESAASRWRVWLGQYTNAVGSRKNLIYRAGFNIDGGGGCFDAAKAMIADEWESYYNPAGTPLSERHISTGNVGCSVTRRPLSVLVNQTTGVTTLLLASDTTTIGPTAGASAYVDAASARLYQAADQAISVQAQSGGASLYNNGAEFTLKPTYTIQTVNGYYYPDNAVNVGIDATTGRPANVYAGTSLDSPLVHVPNSAEPASPTSGCTLFATAGTLKAKCSGGTVTPLALP